MYTCYCLSPRSGKNFNLRMSINWPECRKMHVFLRYFRKFSSARRAHELNFSLAQKIFISAALKRNTDWNRHF